MSEEQNRFSLRKLSVGLASVLIGVSIFGTSQTVKADTVANNQTSSVTNNAQSSDTQENKNVAKSTFSNDNHVDNAKSNLIQTQDKAKNDQTDSLNQNPTNSQEANDSNDLQEKSAEKSIVSPSSAQKINNQLSDHADDNSQTQLDITKNSQQLNQKELATNLTEINKSADDLTTQKDPSKLNANNFANGTKWTTAGWTRTNSQYVARKSKLTLDGFDQNNETHNTDYVNYNLDFTIDKNNLAKNRKILVASIQDFLTDSADTGLHLSFDPSRSASGSTITANNQTIGHLAFSNNDSNESDIYFVSDIDGKDLVNDLTIHYKTTNAPLCFYYLPNDTDYGQLKKDGLRFPAQQHIITNSAIYTNHVNFNQSVQDNYPNQSYYVYGDAGAGAYGLAEWGAGNKTYQYVIKLKSTDPTATMGHTTFNCGYNLIDKDGKFASDQWGTKVDLGIPTKQSDNLSALDLLNNTKINTSSYSKQADGSYLVCVKIIPNEIPFNKNDLKSYTSRSYFANYAEPGFTDKIIQNTLDYNSRPDAIHNFSTYTAFAGDQNKPSTIFYTDVTPGKPVSDTKTMQHTVNGATDTDIELYRHTNLSYIDDITNKTISSDVLTGRKGQNLEYTITIPKNYLLVTPTDGTNYKWNTDHTKITYTFADNQSLNEKNPIIIHLTHKHSAITDSSQLQTTGKRTITITLPHQNKPMIIIQTVGYKRTGDLDEATNTPTYTDWVFDADTSNVTVDGQLSTQYQAYVLKDGVVNYAPIKLPHINGYKTKLIQDKANPAMFMVSFMAVPTENKPSIPDEVAPSKPSANPDNTNKPADALQQRVITKLNSNDSGWTMPNTQPATYTVEVPDDAIIDLSDLVIAEPVHAQTTTQIRVTKRFKLRKHGKKHVAKHLKHRKKAVKSFKKYRL